MSALVVKLILMTMKYSSFNFQDKFHTPTFTRGRSVCGSREAIGWGNRSSLITCKRHIANLPPLLFTERKPEATALKLKSLPLHRYHGPTHTPSTAFRHLPPNSARFSYATEGALLISAQLSSDAVSALRNVCGTDKTVKAT